MDEIETIVNKLIQFDDELPQPINDCIFIPEGTWHRVIKGSGCLKILINEYA